MNSLLSVLSQQWKHANQTHQRVWFFLCTLDRKNSAWEDVPFEICLGRGEGIGLDQKQISLIDGFQTLQSYCNDVATNSPELELYWCPLPFGAPQRRKDQVLGSAFLWADLDEADLDGVPQASLLWETSPGRTQALWSLEEWMSASVVEPINRRMTFFCEADPSGWDLVQVLRVPGSLNNKKEQKFRVRILEDNLHTRARIPPSVLSGEGMPEHGFAKSHTPLPQSFPSLQQAHATVRSRCGSALSARLRQSETPPRGNRSELLWRMSREMWEHRVDALSQFVVLQSSVWNKFAGRRDGDQTLWDAIAKSQNTVGEPKTPGEKRTSGSKNLTKSNLVGESNQKKSAGEGERTLTVVPFESLMGTLSSGAGWMIDRVWSRNSWGIVGGEPKSFKSVLTMEMAVSIASGEPFLGRFAVHQQGPVLVVQNENSPWIMRDRLEKIAGARGLAGRVSLDERGVTIRRWPRTLPIHFVNQQGVMLDHPDDQNIVENLIAEIQPVLVIFDPFYLMFGGEMNSARELQPTLQWLLSLQARFGCAIQLVHHKRKDNKNMRGGQALMGSVILHGWCESQWSVSSEQTGGDSHTITVWKEFRGAPSGAPLKLAMTMNNRAYDLRVDDDEKTDGLHLELVDSVRRAIGENCASLHVLKQKTGASRSQLKGLLHTLERENVLVRHLHQGERVWSFAK